MDFGYQANKIVDYICYNVNLFVLKNGVRRRMSFLAKFLHSFCLTLES